MRSYWPLANIIVPHFDKFPLFAKKKNDYAIWREAVLFIYSVFLRERRPHVGGRGGRQIWFPEDIETFRAYHQKIRGERLFNANGNFDSHIEVIKP